MSLQAAALKTAIQVRDRALYPWEIHSLPVAKLIEGAALGVVEFGKYGAGFRVVARQCADCGTTLPALDIYDNWDTFPRCPQHAF